MASIHYDFGAADALSQKLSQLAQKLDWLVWLRNSQRGSMLGDPDSDHWSGKKRDQFEKDFHREQSRLTALSAEAKRMKSTVDTATENAHAELKAEQQKEEQERRAQRIGPPNGAH
ncbi:hypothetical protein GCM10023322_44540 [Rugosimonospora acidiphila]|uniref:Uncharacterized protein n=1 Tax=Rugosimonospora acidiphila TaxID=556531 RepID=A0ABP9S2N8_9ACTN